MGPREHEWERERIHLELEELTENVRRALVESQTLLREVEGVLNRRLLRAEPSAGSPPRALLSDGTRVRFSGCCFR